jgi:hypothetical protein
LNWLCDGLKAFFLHTKKPMQTMTDLLLNNQPASDIMKILSKKQKFIFEAGCKAISHIEKAAQIVVKMRSAKHFFS